MTTQRIRGPRKHIQEHWPEYLIEASLLATFMLSACTFGILLYHPSSFLASAIQNEFARRVIMGFAMGATAAILIYSPLGKRSGAHFNPATTLTFFRLGKISGWDALFYMSAQFVGGILGVAIAVLLAGDALATPSVNFVATIPGDTGVFAAFCCEFAIAFVLITAVLYLSQSGYSQYTGLAAACLVMLYISFESPISGMSMNPARSLGSAFFANNYSSLWIYFLAPTLGMLMAAECHLLVKSDYKACAKLHHDHTQHCIFCAFHQRKGKGIRRTRTSEPIV